MIEIRNSEQLQRWLLESGHLAPLWDRPRFFFDSDEYDRELAGVRVQYPQFTAVEAEARAALRLMGKEEGRGRGIVPKLRDRRQWTRRERLLLLVLIALVAAIALLFCVPRAHAQDLPSVGKREGFRSALLDPSRGFAFAQGGQPGGIIIQLANSGTVLATTPAGLLQFNCSSGMTCSWTAGSGSNPPTFTLTTSGGGGGSGCIPPGSTPNALLFDAGSGACSDVSKFTWTSGTNTLAGASGGTLDLSALTLVKQRVGAGLTTSTNGDCGYDSTASRWHCWQGGADRLLIAATNAGNAGQPCMSNADGSCTFADPVVSGPDARGAAQSKNPVAGLGGIDYGTGCSGGPCVQEAKVDASGNQYVAVTNTVPVSGTFWQATQPVSLASLPSIPAGSALIGETIPVATAATTDTTATCYLSSAASTNSTNCKSSAGNVYQYALTNTNTTVYYLRMYNTASAPTCSSATGYVASIPVPPGVAAGAVGGIVIPVSSGQAFSTGISFCLTGGSGSTDNTNAATGVFVMILYK